MVVYEAARAMVNLKNVTAKEVQPAVSGVCCLATHHDVLFLGMSSAVALCYSSSDVPHLNKADHSVCRGEDFESGERLGWLGRVPTACCVLRFMFQFHTLHSGSRFHTMCSGSQFHANMR